MRPAAGRLGVLAEGYRKAFVAVRDGAAL